MDWEERLEENKKAFDWDKWWKSSSIRNAKYRSAFSSPHRYYGYSIPAKKDKDKDKDKTTSYPSYHGSYYNEYCGGYDDFFDNRSSVFTSTSKSWGYTSTLGATEQVIMSAYRSARDMIVVLDLPFSVGIKINAYESDGEEKSESVGIKGQLGTLYCSEVCPFREGRVDRVIFIPTSYMDDKAKTKEDKISIFCGLGLHETAHLLHTNLKVITNFERNISSHLKAVDREDGDRDDKKDIYSGEERGHIRNLILLIFNMIEDERVEDLLLTTRPGFLDFISKSKQYLYKKFVDEISGIKITNEREIELKDYLINLFRLIRYPDEIDETVEKTYHKSFAEIKKIMTPLPQTTADVCKKAISIYKSIKRDYKDITLKLKSDDSEFQRIFESILDSAINSITKDVVIGSDGSLYSRLSTNFGRSKRVGATRANVASHDVNAHGDLFEGLFSGIVEKGESSKTYFTAEKSDTDRAKYIKLAKDISPLIPSIRKLVNNIDKNYEFSIYGCRSGKLDENKLAEAYQGVPQVYIRKGEVKTNKTTICVLVDESGSMGRSDSMYSYSCNKAYLARQGAILLNEAFKDCPGIDLYIYGHTGDLRSFGGTGTTTIYKYREGGRGKQNTDSLTHITGRCQNRDGTAIYETAKRVRKFTQNHCIMIVLSDGEPAAEGYYGMSAIRDVRSNVKKVQNTMDMEVIQVCIDTVEGAEDMFDNVIDIKGDIGNLPSLLGKILTKLIQKDKVTTTTM